MFPNLLGQKAYHKLTNDDMARIINVSRPTYERKVRNGTFTLAECMKYAEYFDKPFDYLFEIEKGDQNGNHPGVCSGQRDQGAHFG